MLGLNHVNKGAPSLEEAHNSNIVSNHVGLYGSVD